MAGTTESYDTYEEYVAEKDSVFSLERTQRVAELDMQYKIQLAERENALLRKQQDLDRSEVATKSSLLSLVGKEQELQKLELLNREKAIELHEHDAIHDKQRIQLLEKDRDIRSLELEKERAVAAGF